MASLPTHVGALARRVLDGDVLPLTWLIDNESDPPAKVPKHEQENEDETAMIYYDNL